MKRSTFSALQLDLVKNPANRHKPPNPQLWMKEKTIEGGKFKKAQNSILEGEWTLPGSRSGIFYVKKLKYTYKIYTNLSSPYCTLSTMQVYNRYQDDSSTKPYAIDRFPAVFTDSVPFYFTMTTITCWPNGCVSKSDSGIEYLPYFRTRSASPCYVVMRFANNIINNLRPGVSLRYGTWP